MEEKLWFDLYGYEDYYVVNVNGDIKSKRTNKLLFGSLRNGYTTIMLSVNGNKKRLSKHRLIAQTFLPEDKERTFVNHINGVKTDNRLINLEWCSRSENMIHSYRVLNQKKSALNKFGKDNPRSKYVNQFSMNDEFIKTHFGLREAMRETGVNSNNISSCISGRLKHAGGFKWKAT